MRQRGFALFEVLLAVVLMAIAAAGSYTLVKTFRANSSTQQVIRYTTNITQNFMPFLNGSSSSTVLTDDKLAKNFLTSTGISTNDLVCEEGSYCYVKTNMPVTGGGGAQESQMNFGVYIDPNYTLANEFAIGLQATGTQVNQILQGASSLFSVYCAVGAGVHLNSIASNCALQPSDNAGVVYSLFLVFPKSEGAAPNINLAPPALA